MLLLTPVLINLWQVKRVQGLVDTIDRLRGENTNPPSVENEVIVTTQWETFDSDVGSNVGSLDAPPSSSNSVNKDWETF